MVSAICEQYDGYGLAKELVTFKANKNEKNQIDVKKFIKETACLSHRGKNLWLKRCSDKREKQFNTTSNGKTIFLACYLKSYCSLRCNIRYECSVSFFWRIWRCTGDLHYLRNDVPDERLFEAFSNLGHLTGMLNMKRL
jgi:hypothetical protein